MAIMDSLQLNLITENTTVVPSDSNRKRTLETDEEPSNEDQPTEINKYKRKKPSTSGNEENHNTIPGTENKEFISSLFNHNPDIPQLELAGNVQPVQEAVFTGKTFGDVAIHPHLIKNLGDLQIQNLTLVQSKSIPVILAGKDVLVKSQTGSGKTFAYAIPILQTLQEIRPKIIRSDGTYALVIVPTRELAIQTFEWLQKICRTFNWIVPGVILGGENKKSEKARVRKGINILVSTPGRLIDHIEHTKCLSLEKIRWLVLDEADRMLELGYEREVQKIITALNEKQEPENSNMIALNQGHFSGKNRQTILLSATLTQGIEQLSEISMKHPVFIDAAVEDTDTNDSSERQLTTPEHLKQNFIIVPAKLRLVALAAFVLWKCRFSSQPRKLLIFMPTQDSVDYHCELLGRCLNSANNKNANDNTDEENELTSDAKEFLRAKKGPKNENKAPSIKIIEMLKLHGSMSQKDRMDVFKKFRGADSDGSILLCTDVAARGLDLPQVDWIVQYNPPISCSDYVHRVGRTARIGAKGSSLLFVLPSEANFVVELETQKLLLAELTVERVLEKLYQNAEESPRTGRYPHSIEEAATDIQMKLENAVVNDNALHESACQAYVSYVRSYASYPKDIRHIFSFKALHLGHIAKSYALRDPPTKITGLGKGNWVKTDVTKRKKEQMRKKDELKREQTIIRAQKKRINQKTLIVSEFSSGFQGIDQQTRKENEKKSTKKFIKK